MIGPGGDEGSVGGGSRVRRGSLELGLACGLRITRSQYEVVWLTREAEAKREKSEGRNGKETTERTSCSALMCFCCSSVCCFG